MDQRVSGPLKVIFYFSILRDIISNIIMQSNKWWVWIIWANVSYLNLLQADVSFLQQNMMCDPGFPYNCIYRVLHTSNLLYYYYFFTVISCKFNAHINDWRNVPKCTSMSAGLDPWRKGLVPCSRLPDLYMRQNTARGSNLFLQSHSCTAVKTIIAVSCACRRGSGLLMNTFIQESFILMPDWGLQFIAGFR